MLRSMIQQTPRTVAIVQATCLAVDPGAARLCFIPQILDPTQGTGGNQCTSGAKINASVTPAVATANGLPG
jgi:hypothetical protein